VADGAGVIPLHAVSVALADANLTRHSDRPVKMIFTGRSGALTRGRAMAEVTLLDGSARSVADAPLSADETEPET
jgi:hypothetical protein